QLLPNTEELAAGFKEKILVQQAIVDQRTRLFPITNHHSQKSPVLRSGSRATHRLFKRFRVVLLLEPVACLAQPGFAPQIVNLKMQLSLFVRRFSFHNFPFSHFGSIYCFTSHAGSRRGDHTPTVRRTGAPRIDNTALKMCVDPKTISTL